MKTLIWETHDDGAYATTPAELLADNHGDEAVADAVAYLKGEAKKRGFHWSGVCFGGGASGLTFITVRHAGVTLPHEDEMADCCLYESDVPRRSSAGRRSNPSTQEQMNSVSHVIDTLAKMERLAKKHNATKTDEAAWDKLARKLVMLQISLNIPFEERIPEIPLYQDRLNWFRRFAIASDSAEAPWWYGGPIPHSGTRRSNPPASRFVLLDAGPSAGHHGADDRYTLICTAPQGSGSRAYYNYLGFGTGVSGHGEFTASEFRALKAERYRSLGKSIKIEALPANMRRLAESFIADCG